MVDTELSESVSRFIEEMRYLSSESIKNTEFFDKIKAIDEKKVLNMIGKSFEILFDEIEDNYITKISEQHLPLKFLNSLIERYEKGQYHIAHHGEARFLLDELQTGIESVIASTVKNLKTEEYLYDLACNIVTLSDREKEDKGAKALIIDDRIEGIEKPLRRIKSLLPHNFEIHVFKIEEKDEQKFFEKDSISKNIKFEKNGKSEEITKIKLVDPQEDDAGGINFSNYRYIFIDLLFWGKNIGHKLVRKLDQYREVFSSKFDIIILSRSVETDDIQRCLNEGAVAYIFKDRIYSIPYKLAKLGAIEKTEVVPKSQNFRSLYKLSHLHRRKLQREKICESWVRELPKAELHFHLGGCMRPELVFLLSLNICKGFQKSTIQKIEKMLIPFISDIKRWQTRDKLLKQVIENLLNDEKDIEEKNKFQKIAGTKEFKNKTLFFLVKEWLIRNKEEWVKKNVSLDAEEIKIRPPEAFLFPFICEKSKKEGLEIREYQLKCFFIMLLGMDENKIKRLIIKKNMEETMREAFKKIVEEKDEKVDPINAYREMVKQKIREELGIDVQFNIIEKLICAKDTKNLPEYLRGCEYIGSAQLQSIENIRLAIMYLVMESALENIRYLEIRCSPDGFTKGDLNLEEVMKNMFEAVDETARSLYKKGIYIRVNFIITGKRHKNPKEIAKHIGAALLYRDRKNESKLNKSSLESKGYKWCPARVCGFDLAGRERGYRAEEYVEDFTPLFRTSFPITVHAGEADTVESIWEAVFKLHAHRIGHGLVLSEDNDLMNMIRDRKIAIELCPKSNKLTNSEFKYQREEEEPSYPLKEYLNQGLQVTINTDNRALSNSTLSEEFVEAAKLYPELTKWDALRIIKMGFKNAFLPRDEIRELLKAVEEEVYETILKLEGIEK